jgi:thiol-disulfide isomerase/thioredoxin
MASRISKKTWLTQVILIIAVIALVGGALSCDSSSPLGTKAPDFTLPTLTGANITLSELEGTPVVINFWATWCGYCAPELPYFEDIAQQREGEINVIAIDVGQPISEVKRFFGGYEPTMIVALDENSEVFVNYCQNYNNSRGSIPFTLFVDSEGLVQYVKIGAFASEAELWNTLHSVLGITVP